MTKIMTTEPLPRRFPIDPCIAVSLRTDVGSRPGFSTADFLQLTDEGNLQRVAYSAKPSEQAVVCDSTGQSFEYLVLTEFLPEWHKPREQNLIQSLVPLVHFSQPPTYDLFYKWMIEAAKTLSGELTMALALDELMTIAYETCRFEEIVQSVEGPRLEALYASGPNTLREEIERSEEAHEILEIGTKVAEWTLNRIHKRSEPLSDFAMGFYSYIFEKFNYKSAIEYLVNLLIDAPIEIPGVYGPHLATHALKVLCGHIDLDKIYYHYDTRARADTLKRIIHSKTSSI